MHKGRGFRRPAAFHEAGTAHKYRSGSKYWTPLNIDIVITDLKNIPSRFKNSDKKIRHLEPVRYTQTLDSINQPPKKQLAVVSFNLQLEQV